jgi:hypothetical protein
MYLYCFKRYSMWSGKSCSVEITCFCFVSLFLFYLYLILFYFIIILFYFIHLLSDPAFRNIWFNFCVHTCDMYVYIQII